LICDVSVGSASCGDGFLGDPLTLQLGINGTGGFDDVADEDAGH
jgi:hypothetical protein